ncbi:hypothetical protein MINS_13020 [Mycolicibacterium insubricum]|jgi:uncharacterized protein YkwD|nr:hypothetical protein MINS_13020 [Mycolicibacterium insubricum]
MKATGLHGATLGRGAVTVALTAGLLFGAPATALADPDQTLVDLVNEQRAKNGCGPVTPNPQLLTAAQRHADDYASLKTTDHAGSDSSTIASRVRDTGYKAGLAGEIMGGFGLNTDFPTRPDLINGWLNSPGHKKTMLDCRYTEIGMATAEATLQGDQYPTTFAVGVFAKPLNLPPGQ